MPRIRPAPLLFVIPRIVHPEALPKQARGTSVRHPKFSVRNRSLAISHICGLLPPKKDSNTATVFVVGSKIVRLSRQYRSPRQLEKSFSLLNSGPSGLQEFRKCGSRPGFLCTGLALWSTSARSTTLNTSPLVSSICQEKKPRTSGVRSTP